MYNLWQNSEVLERKIVRKLHLAEKVVLVDGLPGCGKTMLSPIVATLERVEKLTYSYEVELICQLNYLRKIEFDAAVAMVRTFTDLKLYNMMMSRETNFRPDDLSSVFRAPMPLRYIQRLFQRGEELIPERVKNEKPILHLATHALLGISQPIFAALEDRVVIIEVVRHPLYMIKQHTMNMNRVLTDVRYFPLYLAYKDTPLPFWALGWEDLFFNSNSVERTIYYMDKFSERAELARNNLCREYNPQILTIPFESFVVEPWPYMEKIGQILGTRITKTTRRTMKRQRVPRRMYAEGVGLRIYKRCGWEPPQADSDENKEFQKRWDFAAAEASSEALEVLNRLCSDYEEKYLGGRKKNGDRYV